METYLKYPGAYGWLLVVSGYKAVKKPKTTAQKEARRNNKLEMDSILDGLTDLVKSKVGSCASEKDLWDNLQDIYANPKEK
jgi:ribonuclease HI